MTAAADALLFQEWLPVASCSMPWHDQHIYGCSPNSPGEYIVAAIHPTDGSCRSESSAAAMPTGVACIGHVIYLRARAGNHLTCEYCGFHGQVREFIQVVAPVMQTINEQR